MKNIQHIQQLENKSNRIAYFDVIRVVACFGVVVTHMTGQRFSFFFPSKDWEVLNIIYSLLRWTMILFIMISGALFLNINKPLNIRNLYSKNILRILCAFLFWSLIYEVYNLTKSDISIWQFLVDVLNGNAEHLWFLKMLIGLYIITPLLRVIVADRKAELYFISLALFTAFIIPRSSMIIGLFDASLSTGFTKWTDSFQIEMALGCSGYYVLGHYLNTYCLSSKTKKGCFLMGIIGFLAIPILTSAYSHYIDAPFIKFYNVFSIFVLFESITVFLFFKDYCNSSTFQNKVVLNISRMTFGIYLIHMLIQKIMADYGITPALFHPLLSIPILSIFVFALSYSITWIIYKIPVIHKYIV